MGDRRGEKRREEKGGEKKRWNKSVCMCECFFLPSVEKPTKGKKRKKMAKGGRKGEKMRKTRRFVHFGRGIRRYEVTSFFLSFRHFNRIKHSIVQQFQCKGSVHPLANASRNNQFLLVNPTNCIAYQGRFFCFTTRRLPEAIFRCGNFKKIASFIRFILKAEVARFLRQTHVLYLHPSPDFAATPQKPSPRRSGLGSCPRQSR